MKVINKFSPAECHARNLLTIVRTLEANYQGLSFTDYEGEDYLPEEVECPAGWDKV